MAHTIPLAGHLGKDKTARRILQRFYWPTLYRDVAELCRTCEECQKTAYCRIQRAPLIPLPIMEEPFQRIATDIVGPLPRSRSGKRYTLVVCDYATRYPEALPLRSIDAEHVAEELVLLFSRVGVPKEILTDQGPIYRLLHVHLIRTTPYHPQTDGLVERFNKHSSQCSGRRPLKRGKTGISSFPICSSHTVKFPKHPLGFLLLNCCMVGLPESPWTFSRRRGVQEPGVMRMWCPMLLLRMRDKTGNMMELVKENVTQSQTGQKRWYDQKARHREFQKGDQVLALLPTSTNTLLAQWQGPYAVLRRVGKVTYQVDMHDK